eukprot:TRINITY_DN12146_c0_g1_i1.p1 TRINITY_DN12146_c0_g1~~TRINITY_DN12146_c0_g1_i1.p1  ORF type:complete len:719 (-),score=168.96 TRINITY_DN12146_c0_g1_i1:49-2205(-)
MLTLSTRSTPLTHSLLKSENKHRQKTEKKTFKKNYHNQKSIDKKLNVSKRFVTTTFGVDQVYSVAESMKEKVLQAGDGFAGSNVMRNGHWSLYADNIIEKEKAVLKRIVNDDSLSTMQKVEMLDQLSSDVSELVDRALVCIKLSPDKEMAYNAQKGYKTLLEFFDIIHNNADLMDLFRGLLQDKDIESDARGFLQSMYDAFVARGAHIKDSFTSTRYLTELSSARNQYIVTLLSHHLDQVEVSDFSLRQELMSIKGAHKYIISRDRKTYFNFSPESLEFIFKNGHSEKLRKFVYENKYKVSNQLQLHFEEFFDQRQRVADLFKIDPLELSLHNLSLPLEGRGKFLEDIYEASAPKATEEKAQLLSQRNGDSAVLKPWDFHYYSNKITSEIETDRIAKYFSFNNVINGLYEFCNDVFSVSVTPVVIKESETWHPDVTKVEVLDNETGNRGFIYLDLFKRPMKDEETTTYPIQLTSTHQEIAMVAINMHLDADRELLTFEEVESLFSCFGRALQALCSESRLQYTSGTRTYYDFYDTPALVLGYFANDYRILKRFARHHKTGKDIPEETVQGAVQAKREFNATKIQWELHTAFLDQMLSKPGNASRATQLSSELMEKYTTFSYPTNTSRHYHNSKLLLEFSACYQPLYNAYNSWRIWDNCFVNDPLNKEMAQNFKSKVLAKGGTTTPQIIMESIVGADNKEHYTKFVNEAILPSSFNKVY